MEMDSAETCFLNEVDRVLAEKEDDCTRDVMDDDGVPVDTVTSEENVADWNHGRLEVLEGVQSVHCESNFGHLYSQ